MELGAPTKFLILATALDMAKVVPATHSDEATSMARTRARLGPIESAVGTLINANVGTPVQTSVHLSMEL